MPEEIKLKRKTVEDDPAERKKKVKKKRSAAEKRAAKSRRKKRRRGFFRLIADLLKVIYMWATNPNARHGYRSPKLLGRTVTYTGFMVSALVAVLLITIMLNNRAITVSHETLVVTGLPSEFEGYDILVMSDLSGRYFGEEQSTLMRKLTSESYDCVVYLGDMTASNGNPEAFYSLIEQVGTKKPVFFIAGDSDPAPVLSTPRDNSAGNLTVKQMVLADWVLGAEERGATYLDIPQKVTKSGASLWFTPDTFINLNVTQALEEYKDELEQESESYLEGVIRAKDTLPLTTYRRNTLFKSQALIGDIADADTVIMLSHEVPSDSQLRVAQEAMSESEKKNYYAAPDVVLSGHYCGGEWKLPLIGTMYADTNILERYGWFPDENMIHGQRSVGSTVVYTTAGLGSNSATLLWGRLNNPPEITIITLTGELPASFLE